MEVVDTPGLNSLRPEHESVARDFLVEADAIVWLFAVGQAAKATEKQALALAQAAGKRVLGVLNKIDRASEEEIVQVSAHVAASLGDLVEAIVPISARRGLEAKRSQAGAGGDADVGGQGRQEGPASQERRSRKPPTTAASRRWKPRWSSASSDTPARSSARPRSARCAGSSPRREPRRLKRPARAAPPVPRARRPTSPPSGAP